MMPMLMPCCRPLVLLLWLLPAIVRSLDSLSGGTGGPLRRGAGHCNLPGPYCGDGARNKQEECDGVDDLNCDGLSCNEDCTCEISGTGPVCGNGVLEDGEACDDGPNNADACGSLGCSTDGTCTCETSAAPDVDLTMTSLQRVNCDNTCSAAQGGDEVLLSGYIYSLGQDDPSQRYKIRFYLTPDQNTCDPNASPGMLAGYSGPMSFNIDSQGNKYFGMGGGIQFFLPQDIERGFYYWCAIVDADNDIEEMDEGNNVVISADRVRIS